MSVVCVSLFVNIYLQCTRGYSNKLLFPIVSGCQACGVQQFVSFAAIFLLMLLVTGVALWWLRRAALWGDSSQLVPTLRNVSFFWQIASNLT